MGLLVNDDRAFEWDRGLSSWSKPIVFHATMPTPGRVSATVFEFEHLGSGIDGLICEHGGREAYLVPSEVGEGVLGDVGDALPVANVSCRAWIRIKTDR